MVAGLLEPAGDRPLGDTLAQGWHDDGDAHETLRFGSQVRIALGWSMTSRYDTVIQ